MRAVDPSPANTAEDGDVRKAILCIFAAMAIFGVIDNYVSRIAEEAGLWQFHFTRALMGLPLLVLATIVGLGRLGPKRAWAVGLRSLVIGAAMFCYFGSLGIMPIAQALAGLFSSPIWVLLISILVFRQRIGIWRIGALAIGVCGVLLVLRPDPADLGLVTILPMMAGVFYAIAAHVTRRLCGDEDPLSMLAANYLVLGTMGAVGLLVFAGQDGGFLSRGWTTPTPTFLALTAMQACGALVGVYLLIRAYQIAEPTIVAILEYSVFIVGPTYAWLVLDQPMDRLGVLGLLLLAVSAALIVLRGRGLRAR